ncbi:MAG: glycosyltransferase family 2 protein [Parvibaculum sp.]|uniref:glycosyltransferase n=1 Tax=Parvibaculum sp. TaxID=2024848 RepID=UPI00284B70D8|nr:glycosyltransferase family 2 protein [Parvibaculum sp.]MDR3499414.1 glycosyltransferase family 2 protein [Parvibaculum sp.]
MEHEIAISILIPTFRRAVLLTRAVESCLAQDVPESLPFEIVVIDNDPERSAEATVAALAIRASRPLRYVHQPEPGVSMARNAGVAAARGQYAAFLDDDERASPQWLRQLRGALDHGGDAAFGLIEEEFEEEPKLMEDIARRCFSRDLEVPQGTDITSRFNYVGTGNSMFHIQSCFGGKKEPFKRALSATGGEDTVFIAELVAEGKRLVWAADAKAWEFVPKDRTQPAYLMRRRYFSGRNRTVSVAQPTVKGLMLSTLWMGVGAAQAILFGFPGLLLAPVSKRISYPLLAVAAGGMGKLLWWLPSGAKRYVVD